MSNCPMSNDQGHGPSSIEGHHNPTVRLLHERSSVRSFFADRPVPREVVDDVLLAGIHAPSGGNLQPFSIIKITSPQAARDLADMCKQDFIGQAPVNLLFCLDFHRLQRWAELEVAPFSATASFRHFWIGFQDTIIAAQNICTAADALGLGSVYIGTIVDYMLQASERFGLPKGVLPVVLLCLGYPKHRPQPRRKLPLTAIVHEEMYRELPDQELLESFEQKYPGRSDPETRTAATAERLDEIIETCREVHGVAFAQKCRERIAREGYIREAHRYFGLHYRANVMPRANERLLRAVKELGFTWFEPWQPYRD